MNELSKEVNAIFEMISRIPVTGDAVDAMAIARAKLRNVYTELQKMENTEKEVEN